MGQTFLVLGEYVFYSLAAVVLFGLLGLGPTVLSVPRVLRKHSILLAPSVGFCYATLAGWYCYALGIRGTDASARYIGIIALLFLVVAIYIKRKDSLREHLFFSRGTASVLLLSAASLFIMYYPFASAANQHPNTFSLANNDQAAMDLMARFVKEMPSGGKFPVTFNSFIDLDGFIGSFRFAPPFAIALTSSFLGLETYQTGSMVMGSFMVMSAMVITVLMREVFGAKGAATAGASLLFMLSPVLVYSIYQGFQSQIFVLPPLLGLVLVYGIMVRHGAGLKNMKDLLPFAGLFHWGCLITYSHIIPLVYSLLFLVWFVKAATEKDWRGFGRCGAFTALTFASVAVFSPHWSKMLVMSVAETSKMISGWSMRYVAPHEMLGMGSFYHYQYLALSIPRVLLGMDASMAKWTEYVLSIFAGVVIAAGCLAVFRKDRREFIIVLSILAFVIGGYHFFQFFAREPAGYMGFKFLSYFMPLLICASLAYFYDLDASLRERGWMLKAGLLAVLVMLNISGSMLMAKYNNGAMNSVPDFISDLRRVDASDQVESINLFSTNLWEQMWQVSFLMNKKLYLAQETYYKKADELVGDWDLLSVYENSPRQGGVRPETIPVNGFYYLRKR